MTVNDIEIGATYRMRTKTMLPKRVIRYDPRGGLMGGNISVSTVRADGTIAQPELWAGNYFIERAIEKIER